MPRLLILWLALIQLACFTISHAGSPVPPPDNENNLDLPATRIVNGVQTPIPDAGRPSLAATTPRLIKPYPGDDFWTMDPFMPGYSVLEPHSNEVYGEVAFVYPSSTDTAPMPTRPLTGNIRVPVFMIDWADFDPTTDPANPEYPENTFPTYVKKTPEEMSAFLNGPHGPAAYFAESSGGQFTIHFDVYGWIPSGDNLYLKNRAHYLVPAGNGQYLRDLYQAMKDVIKTVVGDQHIDLTQYDADHNGALDGFVIVYEGEEDFLFRTQLHWWPGGINSPYFVNGMLNVSELVPPSDPNYALFQSQKILFSRCVSLPEQINAPPGNGFRWVKSWVHELGHLYMGYRDYYNGSTSLRELALSGNNPAPYQPAAMEKYLFAHWIDARQITEDGTYTVQNSNIVSPNVYDPATVYLRKILLDGDPYHYVLLENRYFLPSASGGSYFNDSRGGWGTAESGMVAFEINLHSWDPDQLRLLWPKRIKAEPDYGYSNQIFKPGDVLSVTSGTRELLRVDSITSPGETIAFRASLNPTKNLQIGAYGKQAIHHPFNVAITALDQNGVRMMNDNDTFTLQATQGGRPEFTRGPHADNNCIFYDAVTRNRSQLIYRADELGEAGLITRLAFNITEPPTVPLGHLVIRMKHTPLRQFETMEWDNDDWITVYDHANVSILPGWFFFDLNSPFDFNGVDSLMMDISYTIDTPGAPFWGNNSASIGPDYQWRIRVPNDYQNVSGDLLTWSPEPFLMSQYPDIKIQFGHSVAIHVDSALRFDHGLWNGNVTILDSLTPFRLRADGPANVSGLSNPINLVDLSLLVPRLQVTPLSLRFKEGSGYEVNVEAHDAPTTRPLYLKNTGAELLDITDLAFGGACAESFSLISGPKLPVALAPDEQVRLTVQFAPRVAARTMGLGAALEVSSNDPDHPLVQVPLEGDAVPVELAVFGVE